MSLELAGDDLGGAVDGWCDGTVRCRDADGSDWSGRENRNTRFVRSRLRCRDRGGNGSSPHGSLGATFGRATKDRAPGTRCSPRIPVALALLSSSGSARSARPAHRRCDMASRRVRGTQSHGRPHASRRPFTPRNGSGEADLRVRRMVVPGASALQRVGLLVAEEASRRIVELLQAVFVIVALSVVLDGATAVWGASRHGARYEEATAAGCRLRRGTTSADPRMLTPAPTPLREHEAPRRGE